MAQTPGTETVTAPAVGSKPGAPSPAPAVVAKPPAAETRKPRAASAKSEPTTAAVPAIRHHRVEPRDATRGVQPRVARARAVQPGVAEPPVETAPVTDSTARVARWLAATHGRAAAEQQAEAAMSYYPADDERTEHWRKVLAHLRRE